jgi:3'-phosphoadenosine 5'-phosphosulfate sulfotransferase (PAPS reductase)/FAD synthetase
MTPTVATASKSTLQTTVRSLLRFLKTPPLAPHLQSKVINKEKTTAARYNAIQSFVLKTVREKSQQSSSNNSNQFLLLQRFHALQKDLHARAELYAMDTGAENQLDAKEMSRRAAARAGLQLPILRDDLENEKEPTSKV